MTSDSSDLETLCTELETDADLDNLCTGSLSPGKASDPEEFDLCGNYLIHFPVEHVEPSSTVAVSEKSERPQKRNFQDAELREVGEVVKSRRLENGEGVRQKAAAATKKGPRPRLGLEFSEYIKGCSKQIDDFVTSLSRDFLKKLQFCVRAENDGFEETFRAVEDQHSDGRKIVKMPASKESKPYYAMLFERYIAMSAACREIVHSYDRSISLIKKKKEFKSFNVKFQIYFYAPRSIRVLFKNYIDFLDAFGAEGRGEHLAKELKIRDKNPEVLRNQMVYGYMQALGLKAFDGFTEAGLFRVTVEA